MLSVGIFANNLFIFSVSTLILFQPWFLRDVHVELFSVVIFFITTTFILSSCVNVLSVVFGYVVIRLQLFCIWIVLRSSCFSVFCFSPNVADTCWCVFLFICWYISSIWRSDNQPFFIIVLPWSASIWLVALNLAYSVQIFIIIFQYPLGVVLLRK